VVKVLQALSESFQIPLMLMMRVPLRSEMLDFARAGPWTGSLMRLSHMGMPGLS